MNNDIVIINLDRPRELRYGHKALKIMEQLAGKSIIEIEEILLEGKIGASTIEMFVYAGLQKDAKGHGETLTLERVADLLDEAPSYGDIIATVGKAFLAAFASKEASGSTEGNSQEPDSKPA